MTKHQLTSNKPTKDYYDLWIEGKFDDDHLDKDDVINIAEDVDFDIWCIENKYKKRYYLVDQQGGNLGGIENEVFCNLYQILDRLETYLIDYFKGE